MYTQKSVLAIHDISCVGKCSLTVALPIISAAGVQCSVLPTAVLSTHTGGFSGGTFQELTDELMPIAKHLQREGIRFDAIYSGYLGSQKQLEIVGEIFGMFRTANTLVVVDPAMADNGKLYSGFTQEYVNGMRELCALADVIIPNITEAIFLLGRNHKNDSMSKTETEELLFALGKLGAKEVVLTGVSFTPVELGCACYGVESGQIDYITGEKVNATYHGTGDIFASLLLGALMRGRNLCEAARIAVDYTRKAVTLTVQSGTPPRMGVNFEAVLADYGKKLALNPL